VFSRVYVHAPDSRMSRYTHFGIRLRRLPQNSASPS
jgi:hypothetical protein